MSWENNPNGPQNPGGQNPGGQNPGGQWGQPGQQPPQQNQPQNPQQGGQWGAPQQGQQQGGQWGQPGQQPPQQPPQQGGQWGAPQQGQQQAGQWGQPGGAPQQGQQGFGGQGGQGGQGHNPQGQQGQQGQQGFGGQGYDPSQQGYQPGQQGFAAAQGGGYGAPPSGYANQGRGPGKVILWVIIGVVVVAMIGAGLMFFGKSKKDETTGIDVPPPTAAPASPEPTATRTPSSRPTSTRPTSRPTTSQPSEPSGAGEQVGLGISVEPASGWRVKTRESGTVILQHSSGAAFVVEVAKGSGSAASQARRWQDNVAKGGTDVEKREITPKSGAYPSLDVAETSVVMSMSSGGGSQRIVAIAMIGVNDSKETVSASQLLVPESAAGQSTSLVKDAEAMINSVLRSQS